MARLDAQPMLRQQPARSLGRGFGLEAGADHLAQRNHHRIGDARVVDAGELAGELVGFGIADVERHDV